MLRRSLLFLCLGLIGTLAACAEPALVSTSVVPRAHATAYTLRPNDQVRIRVYNEAEVSGDYQVDDKGRLSIPLAGSIRAAGLTTTQLEHAIASRLEKGIIRDPRVAAQVVNYGPFYIRGEVKRGGEYPFRPGLTALDAVAVAGGFTYRADESKFYVRRAGASTEQAYSANDPVEILPGDNVRIAERFF
jgi:polysaccharide export outer membrane protein